MASVISWTELVYLSDCCSFLETSSGLSLGLFSHMQFSVSVAVVSAAQSDGLPHAEPSAGLNFEGVQYTLT